MVALFLRLRAPGCVYKFINLHLFSYTKKGTLSLHVSAHDAVVHRTNQGVAGVCVSVTPPPPLLYFLVDSR